MVRDIDTITEEMILAMRGQKEIECKTGQEHDYISLGTKIVQLYSPHYDDQVEIYECKNCEHLKYEHVGKVLA